MTGAGAERMAVGVCTYNRGPALLRTLEALTAMDSVSGRVTRVVVVDNNCTDGTAERVRGAAAANAGIRVELVREASQGLSHARRRVLEATDEPIIAFVDDDCLPEHGWGAAILGRFDASARAGAVGGRVMLEWEAGPTALALRCAVELAQQELGDAARLLSEGEYLVGAGLAVRRAALAEAEWPERAVLVDRAGDSLTSGGDTEIGARMRRAGWELWYEPAARMRHLIPAGRQTREYLARLLYSTANAEPLIRWLASGEPGAEWAEGHAKRARARLRRTAVLEWRPVRRFMRLNQRRGRVAGWERLLDVVREGRVNGLGQRARPRRD